MTDNERSIFAVTAVIMFILGMSMGVIHTQFNYVKPLRQEAITLNYAEYNNTNGVWQWKTNTIFERK